MRVLITLPAPPPSPFLSWTLPPTLEPSRRVMDRKPSLCTLPIARTPLATSVAPFSTEVYGPLYPGAVERTRRVLRDAQDVHGRRAYGSPAHPLLGQRYRRHHRQGQKTHERRGHEPLHQRSLLFSACRPRPIGAGSAFAKYTGIAPNPLVRHHRIRVCTMGKLNYASVRGGLEVSNVTKCLRGDVARTALYRPHWRRRARGLRPLL